jgi:hypothetical protein
MQDQMQHRTPNVVQFTQPRIRWATRPLLGLLLLAALIATACQPVQPVGTTSAAASSAPLPQITITARDFAFDMPQALPAGWVSLTLHNTGAVNHHALFGRLTEGTTLDQVKAAIAADNAGEPAPEGPPVMDEAHQFFMPDTDPGASNEATVYLTPGEWVIFSVSIADMSGEDMRADWEQGSIAQFTVTENAESAAPPTADVVLTIGTDDAEMPSEISAGTHTLQIMSDNGTPGASAFILKLEGGATIDDILTMFDAFFSGEEINMEEMPVFRAVGGLMGYTLSDAFYTTIDFVPGDYVAITNINGDDFPYAGLSKSFTVK